MKEKKPTISDIASILNISPATVSRVLSGSSYPVKAELREKILETAKKLNYIPSFSKIISGREIKRSIGIIVPDLSNPYFTQLVLGAESVAVANGYHLIIYSSHRKCQYEKELFHYIIRCKDISGFIISSVCNDPQYFQEHLQFYDNIVLFDMLLSDSSISCVKFNSYEAGYMATEYLLLKGHTQIAFLSPPLTRINRCELLDGYKAALETFGIEVHPEYILTSQNKNEITEQQYEFQYGQELARRCLALPSPPSAVFVINDMAAYGIIREFAKNGVRVPEDISVIGLDNLDFSDMFTPPLTTLSQRGNEAGCLTAKTLIDKIEGRTSNSVKIILHPFVIERKTVASKY